jgi:chemotaxis protein MotB
MRSAWSYAGMGTALVVLLLAAGCNTGEADQIKALQEQNDLLQREKEDLLARLNQCNAETGSQQARIRALMDQLEELRRQGPTTPVQADDSGWVRGEGFAFIDLGSDILFDPGQATLKAAGRAKLSEIVQRVRTEFADHEVWVFGHTDSDPIRATRDKWSDNLDLSVNRSMTVFHELVRLGVNPKQLVAAGQGEYNPKAPNTTSQGKGQNRRVQILCVKRPVTPTAPTVGAP